MKKDLHYLFKHNNSSCTDTELAKLTSTINMKIEHIAVKQRLELLFFCSITFLITLTTGIKVFADIMNSNFSNYLSLLFSDTGVVMSGLYEFTLSLFESLPLLMISIFIASIGLSIMASQKYAFRPRVRNLSLT